MAEHCCPKCKGTTGYQYFETAATGMSAAGWGPHDEPESDGTYGKHYQPSLFECLDCGSKFRESTVKSVRFGQAGEVGDG